MNIILNSKPIDIENNTNIETLLNNMNIPVESVVAIVNRDITAKEYILCNNDKIDLITFVGGG